MDHLDNNRQKCLCEGWQHDSLAFMRCAEAEDKLRLTKLSAAPIASPAVRYTIMMVDATSTSSGGRSGAVTAVIMMSDVSQPFDNAKHARIKRYAGVADRRLPHQTGFLES